MVHTTRELRDHVFNILLCESDRFIWHYSASSAYGSFFIGRTTRCQVWRAVVPPKVKLFFWLALYRITVGFGLLTDEDTTVSKMTRCALFATKKTRPARPLAGSLRLQSQGLVARPSPGGFGSPSTSCWCSPDRLVTLGTVAASSSMCRRGFDSITLLVTRELWKEHNCRTFQSGALSRRPTPGWEQASKLCQSSWRRTPS
jgi:hypothetical protein